MNKPTAKDMVKGTKLNHHHGEVRVIAIRSYGWEVRGDSGDRVVFENQLHHYTIVK